MASVITRRYQRSLLKPKPPPGSPFDRQHPQLEGCRWWWTFQDMAGGIVRDVISGEEVTIRSGNVWVKNAPDGPMVDCTGSDGSNLNLSSPTTTLRDFPLTYNFSILWGVVCTATTANHSLMGWEGEDDVAIVWCEGANERARVFWRDGGFNVIVDDGTPEPTKQNIYTTGGYVLRDIESHELWRDGYITQTNTQTAGDGPFSTFHLGGIFGYQNFLGAVSWVRIYDRALNEPEMKSIARDPWLPFYKRVWVPGAGAAPPATMAHIHYHHRHHNLAG